MGDDSANGVVRGLQGALRGKGKRADMREVDRWKTER